MSADIPDNKSTDETFFPRPSSSSKKTVFFGTFVVVSIFLGLGWWSATAPLARAVAAFATLTIKGERKQIQHFEGGIVGSLHVSEGQMVEQNQLLVALNPLQASANVARHDTQLNQALARQARLESELEEEETIVLSGKILSRLANDPKVGEILDAEQRHLIARRETMTGTIAILQQRIQQLKNEIVGLKIQKQSREEQLKIFRDELIGLKDLYDKGFYPRSKILAMERAMVDLKGASGNDMALIARAKSAMGEANNQIVSVKQRFREDVIKQLRDVKVEISDTTERLTVATDVLDRIEIRAPKSGIVQGMRIHTLGGVIRPGDILMEIIDEKYRKDDTSKSD